MPDFLTLISIGPRGWGDELLRGAGLTPGLSHVVLSLIKQTSLVAVISYEELLRTTAIAAGSTHQPLFFFAIACLLYLALTALVAVAFRRADLAVNRGLRAP